jgi:hypothetical protein
VNTVDRRRVRWAVAAVFVMFAAGTVGFRASLGEGWLDAFYRTVVTATLTGLDRRPTGAAAELITIGLVLGGVAIFAYVAAVAVQTIASGKAWKEKRRRRMIEELRDHIILGDVTVGVGAPNEIRALEALFAPQAAVAR